MELKPLFESERVNAEELRQMIQDYIIYHSNPLGMGDHEIAAANMLPRSCLRIARQLLEFLENDEKI